MPLGRQGNPRMLGRYAGGGGLGDLALALLKPNVGARPTKEDLERWFNVVASKEVSNVCWLLPTYAIETLGHQRHNTG